MSMSKSTNENWIWRAILILAGAGVVFVGFVSVRGGIFFSKHEILNYFVTFGIALLISGASFCFGGLSGFLFGIPRIINSTSAQQTRSTVMQNDNLVQISDWLTKILVGVGLTQIYEIPNFLKKIGDFLAPCFSGDNTGAAIAVCLVLYFLILGFMACYLWTRFYFSEMLEDTINDTDGDDTVNKMVNTTVQNMTINPPAADPTPMAQGTVDPALQQSPFDAAQGTGSADVSDASANDPTSGVSGTDNPPSDAPDSGTDTNRADAQGADPQASANS